MVQGHAFLHTPKCTRSRQRIDVRRLLHDERAQPGPPAVITTIAPTGLKTDNKNVVGLGSKHAPDGIYVKIDVFPLTRQSPVCHCPTLNKLPRHRRRPWSFS